MSLESEREKAREREGGREREREGDTQREGGRGRETQRERKGVREREYPHWSRPSISIHRIWFSIGPAASVQTLDKQTVGE